MSRFKSITLAVAPTAVVALLLVLAICALPRQAPSGRFAPIPFLRVASEGNVELAKRMLNDGADLHVSDRHGETALHYATFHGEREMVQFLLEQGADANAAANNGHTPLFSTRVRTQRIVQMLPYANGKNGARDKSKILEILTQPPPDEHAEIMRLLIEAGAELDAITAQAHARLYDAARNGDEETVSALLANGAEVNARVSRFRATALHSAAWGGHLDMVEFLLANGAEIDAPDKRGETPMYEASGRGHQDVVELLLAEGASVNAHGGWRQGTPLMRAAGSGHAGVAELLIRAGADVDALSKDGDTSLHVAAENGHVDVAQVLVSNGANVNVRNDEGNTPLECAEGRRYYRIASVGNSPTKVSQAHVTLSEILKRHAR